MHSTSGGVHESVVEWENHLPRPGQEAGHASFYAVQDIIGFLSCKCTLPSHVELIDIKAIVGKKNHFSSTI